MNRADRRRFDKEFPVILRKDGDHCTLCRRELEHNVRTFGGMTPGGKVALTTECCRAKLAVELVSGLYTTRHSETLSNLPDRGKVDISSDPDVTRALDALQGHFSEVDRIAGDVQRRAGVRGRNGRVNIQDSPWKTDDAAWFKANPDRSHRLRPMLDGEASSLPPELTNQPMPEGHRFEVVIRQIEPGKRVRLPFGRNISVPIPDYEAIIHALFDQVAGGTPGRVISVREVAEIATLHEDTGNHRIN